MTFKAVIFDLDGTLLDTIDDIADAINLVLARRGFPTHDVDTYKRIVGAGIEDLIGRVLPEKHRDEDTITTCMMNAYAEYQKRRYVKTKPYEGIVELLDELVRRGIKIAVLSNKPHESAVRQIAQYFPKHSFVRVEGARPDRVLKPLPDVAHDILNDMNAQPSECLMVGDVEMDILTAINAGMYPVGVSWGFRTATELKAAGVKTIIDEPRELLGLFES